MNKKPTLLTFARPEWIRVKVSADRAYSETQEFLKEKNLNTVCIEAECPNRPECWGKRHVTFMILGSKCTRNCRFCGCGNGKGGIPDPTEPERIAKAVKKLGMKYVVITSVTRDDLADKGTEHFTKTVSRIKELNPDTEVELLIPDFDAKPDLLRKVAFSGAEIIGHNIEMPKALYPRIRPKSNYERSLNVLSILGMMKEEAVFSLKSSIMLGLGENEVDITRTLNDLKIADVDIVYMGQYLSPSSRHWPVKKYYTPEEFNNLRKKGKELKFHTVHAAPLVRSSYKI